MMNALFSIFIFPGFLFLGAAGLVFEYVDRILYARFQNRMGPPWFQPLADVIKLFAKEEIIPEDAEPKMFKALPVFALTASACAIFYIPIWGAHALVSFPGDAIVVVYLLTIPTLTFFLAGWSSSSLYSMLGAVRSLTQLFAYEVPLFLGILSAGMLADTWSLSGMADFYSTHPWYWAANSIGFAVCLIALQGKLEKVPFDMPEAETEIVGGTFTEYSGRLLALFRMAIDTEMVVGAALLAAVFLPFGLGLGPVAGFAFFVVKIFFVVFLMALIRSVMARLRIEQMVDFCWRYLAPAAFVQLIVNLVIKGVTSL